MIDGHLLLNMIPRSLKALDLLHDARIYVHLPVTAKSGDPELKLAGTAQVLDDDALRRKLDDLFWEKIQWRPAADSHYFEVLIERAAYVTYDDKGQTVVRWRSDRDGVLRTHRAGI